MKVGDLIKFRGHTIKSGPVGIVIGTSMLRESPHLSQPDRSVAYIVWACKYTMDGNYQLSILEVIDDT